MHAPVSNKAMSQRQAREERRLAARNLPVASKCLAIVLLPQKKQTTKNSEDVNGDRDRKGTTAAGSTAIPENTKTTGLIGGNSAGAPYNGKTLLEDFKQQNKTCYWNPALIESIRQLEYLGFVEPCTVLVGGEDIHLENLRSAWGRRVLKAPVNFTIDRIGDVNGIEMQVIPQTQFIPLPDSLCLIITELNNAQQAATLDSIRARLQRWYQNTTLPSHQLIYDTLGQLIRERKVFHNGGGYCVVTPETYHLPTADPSLTCTASWLPYHPMYIPVFPQQQHTFRAPTRSISCQVTQIEEKSSEGSVQQQQQQQQKSKPRPRSHSVRACRGKDKAAALAEKENADFKRTMSVKYKSEKAKAMTKDLNLKTSNLNQEKDKGEKVSLFSKIFGRKKKKLAASGATTASTSSGGGNQASEVEYATFSAQFPPPEWVWYQQQLERHRRTEEWVSQQTTKSTPWQHFSSTGAEASSGGTDSGNHDMTLTEFSHAQTDIYAAKPQHGHVYATLGHMQGISETGVPIYGAHGGHEKRDDEERRLKQLNRLSGSHVKKTHGHGNHHREHHHHKHREHRKTVHENNYDVPHTQSQVQSRANGNANMDVSPMSLETDSVYATPGPSQSTRFIPWHSTPCYDVPPSQLDSHAMPSNIVYNTTQEQSESVKPHHHRRSHRTKRRGHRAYSYYDTGNDISIEYKGRMPKKNSSVAQSRDSGVNCMGLPQNRQLYVNQPILHTTQESVSFPAAAASADQPTLTTTPATATASSLQPHTISTQRGTPYNSMEHRSPEGSSGSHAVIINDISTDIADAGTNETEQSPGSGESGSGVAGPLPDGCSVPRMEDRSECEGLSQDLTPNFVAMSYCDSSLGDEGAGGGEVILCQAEINQFQIPQLVLDTEPHGYRNNLGAEPDVALSSGGSKDTLDRTADESERSAETVIRSPQSVVDASKYSSRSSESDAPQHKSMTSHKNSPVQESNSGTPTARGEEMTGEDENHAVRALGNELQEMGVVDSGFSSPRNTDDKENQQLQQQQPPAADARPTRHKNGSQPGRGHHHHNHNHNNVNEASEEYTVPEHKSKHERIKAYVKQSNQLLEQRQFTSHGHSNGNAVMYSQEMDAYPVCHPHHHPHPHPHPHPHQHYAPIPKPLHPVQHHHQPPPPPQQQQPQQPVLLNNQRHHHQGRPHSMHGGMRERPRSQNVWGGDKVAPNDLQAFQQQQLSSKKFGLNGEFEVVGVV